MMSRLTMASILVGGALAVTVSVLLDPATAQCGGKADCGIESEETQRIDKQDNRFYFRNNCRHPVRVALKWYDRGGARVDGWWSIEPETGIYLTVEGNPIQLTSNTFYYYAYSTNRGDVRDWVGDHRVRFGDQYLDMRRREAEPDRDGNRQFSIGCPD